MLVSTEMITGFNTDVPYQGNVYHVQTEDGGTDNPILESLIYIGGTIVAKKLTPYPKTINEEARQETLASLLKRQHQVIIAAIKAGRIEDLIRHSLKQQSESEDQSVETRPAHPKSGDQSIDSTSAPPKIDRPIPADDPIHLPVQSQPSEPAYSHNKTPAESFVPVEPVGSSPSASGRPANRITTGAKTGNGAPRGETAGLNLDAVLEDYVKRGAGQAKLDVKVLTPDVFSAGTSIGLKVQVTHESTPDFNATVTVKIIGTAFKPQVFIGRVGRDGIANFSLTLPSFSTGTAAIVIEAQSGTGHGELKNLIRRT